MQTTSFAAVGAGVVIDASKRVFDLELSLANACSFVPMDFCHMDRQISQPDLGYALALSPSPSTVAA